MSANAKAVLSARQELVPHLAAYDAVPVTLRPYVTLGAPRNARSETVTTDAEGFRHSWRGDRQIDSTTWFGEGRRGLTLGGSFTFGVGATSDRLTVASLLSERSGISFLNLGVRCANSTQELITAIPFLHEADAVVLMTGVNNAFTSLRSLRLNDLYGPLFWEGSFEHLSEWPIDDLVALTYEAGGSLALRLARRVRLVRRATRSARRARASHARGRSDEVLAAGMVAAGERHARDLAILARALPDGCRCIFAVQPFAPVAAHVASPEEERLFALTEEVVGPTVVRVNQFAAAHWAGYVERLRAAAEAVGADFLDLNTTPLEGWCFVDRVHMNDRGHRLVAEPILELLA